MAKQLVMRRTPKRSQTDRKIAAVEISKQDINQTASEQNETCYRELARLRVLAAWPDILHGLIEKAKAGGYQHVKLLLELCRLGDANTERDSSQEKRQLCDALLEGLGLKFPADVADRSRATIAAKENQ